MQRRLIAVAMASVLSVSVAGSLHAAPLAAFHHTSSEKASGKMISFSVRNDSKDTLVLKAGEQQYTIQPGKSASLKLEEGAEVLSVNGTSNRAAGSLITKVSSVLQGNTLAVS